MKSDIQIARETPLKKIKEVAENIGIDRDEVHNYGPYMAKVPLRLKNQKKIDQSNLVLVTAITPTKAGIGKTTVSIGLALGLNKIGKKAIVALREPSLGPVFGMKGGAAGGGYAQVLPMENINLHFTGDFHAVTSAHNTISALLDNYIFRVQGTPHEIKEVLWKRVLDVNDRSLRYIVTGLGPGNGVPLEGGFDITAASELMAILCLAEDEEDLRRRIENILLGYTREDKPFTVKDLGVAGAITVLMKDAIHPNLVQTTENTAAFVHGGPFANIAHGCNSVSATKMAMSYGEYVITEAGFGADLGAEKFFNIKCRKSGLQPKLTVIVVTAQGLKMHGGTPETDIRQPDMEGLKKGLENLSKHLENLASFGQTVVVAFNKYAFDTQDEIDAVAEFCRQRGVRFAVNNAFVEGGQGAVELANAVVEAIEKEPSQPLQYTYSDEDSIRTKLEKIALNIYGARDVVFNEKALRRLKRIDDTPLAKFPVCIAKTQFSFSADPKEYGVAKGFRFKINDIVINQGSEFIVAIAGEMMRMPGLPADPQAKRIDIVNGKVEGLS
ncbi:MAG: formate--tetrahydrofolate ligase [Petrimonas sp.]|uniref:formate--tetrahydrofolate ligase n=1 Tax=Petrimonas sulfuriphila TaxID=285070 RepID=UPI000F0C6440|nr:formate--tetrahydrofolate ligase [Petrimonas sp.]MDD4536571.1 formate--tetrahydrofolate ligase [Petrimonas sp.]BBD45448.1 formate--tetrahydrofolate ligase [Petrimonas sp. IBARAKI]